MLSLALVSDTSTPFLAKSNTNWISSVGLIILSTILVMTHTQALAGSNYSIDDFLINKFNTEFIQHLPLRKMGYMAKPSLGNRTLAWLFPIKNSLTY